MRAVNLSRDVVVARSGRRARSLWERSRGLLGRKGLEPGEALLLEPCSGIHTIGMAFPIDALFLDKQGIVVHMALRMAPFRMTRYILRAHSVLELPAGTIQATGTEIGDRLAIEE